MRRSAMKSNLTLKVDTELVKETKVLAARQKTSVSRLLADQLEELVRDDRAYEAARRRALARLDKGYDLGWEKPADRQELHDR